MSIKDLKRQIAELEKSLKGETDLNVVLDIWGKLDYFCKILKREELNNGSYTEDLQFS